MPRAKPTAAAPKTVEVDIPALELRVDGKTVAFSADSEGARHASFLYALNLILHLQLHSAEGGLPTKLVPRVLRDLQRHFGHGLFFDSDPFVGHNEKTQNNEASRRFLQFLDRRAREVDLAGLIPQKPPRVPYALRLAPGGDYRDDHRGLQPFPLFRDATECGSHAAWRRLHLPGQPEKVAVLGIAKAQSSELFVGTWDAGIYKSVDGGDTWRAVNTGLTELQVITVLPSAHDDRIWAGTAGRGKKSGVFLSTDKGESWRLLCSLGFDARVLVQHNKDADTLYLATTRGVFRSTDGGVTWRELPVPCDSKLLYALVKHPTDADTLYAGFEREGVFSTTNGGDTWHAMNAGLTNPRVDALCIQPKRPNVIYAGTSNGPIFKTTDAGRTWRVLPSSGLPQRGVRQVILDLATNTLYAAAYDNGAYTSHDDGATWTPAARGLENEKATYALMLDPTTHRLYAGTATNGLFTLDLA